MSDLMLHGKLNMPLPDEPQDCDVVTWVQFKAAAKEAADRIEELEAENHLLKNSGIVEVAVRNPNVMEYMRHWEGRAEAAEAKLAKAVAFIEDLEGCEWPLDVQAKRFLASLQGDKK